MNKPPAALLYFICSSFWQQNECKNLYFYNYLQLLFGSYAIQDPMRGGKDDMFEDIVAIIHADDQEARAKDAVAPPRRRLVPEFMLKLARSISPF